MSDRINDLITRAQASRESLRQAGDNLRSSSNVGQRLQNSIRSNLTAWLGSAAVFGLVLAKLPARKKKVIVRKNSGDGVTESAAKGGIFVALLGLVFQMARPVLQKLLVEQAGIYARKFHQKHTEKVPRSASPNL